MNPSYTEQTNSRTILIPLPEFPSPIDFWSMVQEGRHC